jgi:hypothetical protein
MLFENGISDAPSPVAVADAPDDRSGLTSSAVATGAARETGWRQKLQEQDCWRRAAPRSWQVMDGCASYGEVKNPRRSARLVDDDVIAACRWSRRCKSSMRVRGRRHVLTRPIESPRGLAPPSSRRGAAGSRPRSSLVGRGFAVSAKQGRQ